MARVRTKRIANMTRAELMLAAEKVTDRRYHVASRRIASGQCTLLGLFNYEPTCWVIEIHSMDPPQFICITQDGIEVGCHQVVGANNLDWKLWLGTEHPSPVNQGDWPETHQHYHQQAVNHGR